MKTYSADIQFYDGPGKIHGFSTGKVSVKHSFRTARGGVHWSKINFLLDSGFTEWMPIWVWVIAHPEGIFVVDTGENARVSEPEYFDGENWILRKINQTQFRFDVSPEDEAGPQLTKLGIRPEDIRTLILTQLHLDHFDGLHHFEGVDIVLNRYEWEHPGAALPSLYPEWFAPRLLDLRNGSDTFPHSIPLTKSGEISLIHTPGHTRGHCSVLVKGKETDFFAAGDVTYTEDQLKQGVMAGGHSSFKLSSDTFGRIRQYARHRPMVYLPSHDIHAGERLEKGICLE